MLAARNPPVLIPRFSRALDLCRSEAPVITQNHDVAEPQARDTYGVARCPTVHEHSKEAAMR